MANGRTRRAVTTLLAVIAVLLTTAATAAVDRLRPAPDPFATSPIAPSYVVLPVADAPVLEPAVARPRVTTPAAAAPRASGSSCPAMPAVPAAKAAGARATVPRLSVYDAPDGRVTRVLDNPTVENAVLNTLVLDRRGAWLRVQLPVRPNGTSGWVRAADMAPYEVPYRIVVQLCRHRLTLFKGGREVWAQPVAIGAPGTPTPKGAFYVDFITPMRASGAYGPYLVSVAGFSNVLNQFGKNGIGQIGIHGTNRPSSIGTSASHGCVRLRNDTLRALVKVVPEGTPVLIVD